MSLEERQSRQMRSFLQNFLADERGSFHKVLDLRQHALDTGITVTDATVQEVVNAMPDVRGLRLTGCAAVTDAGVWTIARQCAALDTIYLAGCERVTELSLRVLAHNCRLVTIDLSDCPQVDDSVLQTLAAGSWTLETFIIQRSRRITDAGIVKIAQCCKRLRHLDVSECEHVGEYGDKALVEIGRCCHELQVLDLFGCRHVHDVGIKAVAKGCPRLTTLKLTGCHGVSSVALRVLAEQRPPLEILSLAGCVKTTNEDLDAIARNCPRIHWLDISGSPLIDATGVRALARFCDKLTFLNLSHCQRINDAALLELRVRTSLTQLSVAHCPRITEFGIDALTAACTSLLTLDMTECSNIGRRFLQQLVQKLEFVEWATTFFGFQPLPNAAALVVARDRRLLEQRSAIKIQAAIRGCLARGGVWEAKLKYVQRKTLPKIQAKDPRVSRAPSTRAGAPGSRVKRKPPSVWRLRTATGGCVVCWRGIVACFAFSEIKRLQHSSSRRSSADIVIGGVCERCETSCSARCSLQLAFKRCSSSRRSRSSERIAATAGDRMRRCFVPLARRTDGSKRESGTLPRSSSASIEVTRAVDDALRDWRSCCIKSSATTARTRCNESFEDIALVATHSCFAWKPPNCDAFTLR
ncbi:hypothetical protein PINS_up015530 [Pythium insidiosum]|nr:hypothetical protein PINS_up015530 [Pythium insidiosum]